MEAFPLAIFGLLGIYWELIFPGRIYPGVLGASAALGGAYCIWRDSASALGITMAAAGLLLFLAEALWNLHSSGGIAGAICFIGGSINLFPHSPRFVWLAAPLSLIFSAITLLLAKSAQRARRNKGTSTALRS
jgi:membrane-bound serine protease (ClpP class)